MTLYEKDYAAGGRAALDNDLEESLDGKNPAFIAGFTQCMRELNFLEGNPDNDNPD